VYYQEQQPPACPYIFFHKAYNSRLTSSQRYKLLAGKKETQKMKPSCMRNRDPELFEVPPGIPADIRFDNP
jgi:hypothetical protein